MTEFDKNIYQECIGNVYLLCKVCNKQIVKSYHKKHINSRSHIVKVNDFKYINFIDEKLDSLQKRTCEYEILKNQANSIKRMLLDDIEEYQKGHMLDDALPVDVFKQKLVIDSLLNKLN